jgi:hypothetical protein
LIKNFGHKYPLSLVDAFWLYYEILHYVIANAPERTGPVYNGGDLARQALNPALNVDLPLTIIHENPH